MSAIAKKKMTMQKLIVIVFIAVVVGLMIFNTKIVVIGSEHDVKEQQFSPQAFGAQQFPKIQAFVTDHAVDALELSTALAADKENAVVKYGTKTSMGTLFSVKFTGIVLDRKGNMNSIAIAGFPEDIKVRVQTGPALNGTDLRDVNGKISFSDFKNQIEYQNAGSAINNEAKTQILSRIDPNNLNGKSIEVVGVFKAINPKNWLVIPVRFNIK